MGCVVHVLRTRHASGKKEAVQHGLTIITINAIVPPAETIRHPHNNTTRTLHNSINYITLVAAAAVTGTEEAAGTSESETQY